MEALGSVCMSVLLAERDSVMRLGVLLFKNDGWITSEPIASTSNFFKFGIYGACDFYKDD